MTGTAWERLGLIFRAEGQRPWMRTHAQMPHAELIEGSVYRVYFTCRDEQNRSHVAWLVVDLERPSEVLELAAEPLLAPGRCSSATRPTPTMSPAPGFWPTAPEAGACGS